VARLLKVVRYNYPVAVKHSMELMGRPVGFPRRPLLPLSVEEKAWVKGELGAVGVFESEPRGWKA
jgi:dihydrodipicolinate synthase/N-acetylneuraminate lyase